MSGIGASGGFGSGKPAFGPLTPDAVVQHAAALRLAGKPLDALAHVDRALLSFPDNALLLHVRAGLLMETQRFAEALAPAKRAVDLVPNDAGFRSLVAMLQGSLGKIDEAIATYRAALALEPGHAPSMEGLVEAFRVTNDTAAADAAFKNYFASTRQPSPVVITAAADFLLSTARGEQAGRTLQSGMKLYPGETRILSVLPGTLNYLDVVTPIDVVRAHAHCGSRFAAALNLPRCTLRNARTPGKRLKIGYMSPDFRGHSVAYFLEPLLDFHDRSQFEIYAYATFIPGNGRDAITERLSAKCDHFHETNDLAGHALADRIASDGIDILVDLAGWTGGCRPVTILRKPAPLIVGYLGYPNISGLPTIDARIVDTQTDPPNNDGLDAHGERLIRLDRPLWCFQPPADAPAVAPAPHTSGAPFTFASFNATKKISPTAARFWAAAVNAVPNARLLIKAYGLADPFIVQKYRELFQRCGLDPARVEFRVADRTIAEHLDRYRDVDIALDTFPYNGTTTTCEALWMGVPVVSIAGKGHWSRVGQSLLGAVGLADLVGQSPEHAAQLASSLAHDSTRITTLRSTLRERFAASPLRDARGLCAALESAYRDLWVSWCRGTGATR